MKKIKNYQSGFTLIEIIVVLIIVGILAAIALPNLFSNIAKSRGAEALTTLDAAKPAIEGCIAQYITQAHSKCLNVSTYQPTSPNFTYTETDSGDSATATFTGANAPTYTIKAVSSNGNISLTRSTAGTFTCQGTSALLTSC